MKWVCILLCIPAIALGWGAPRKEENVSGISGMQTYSDITRDYLETAGWESVYDSTIKHLKAAGATTVTNSTIDKLDAEGSTTVRSSTIKNAKSSGDITCYDSSITQLTGYGRVSYSACSANSVTVYGSVYIDNKSDIKTVTVHQEKGAQASGDLATVRDSTVNTIHVYEKEPSITPYVYITNPIEQVAVIFHEQEGIVKTNMPDMVAVTNGAVKRS